MWAGFRARHHTGKRNRKLNFALGLARISHQFSAAASDEPRLALFSRFGVLDVL
jgi:hypothetical protein